MKNSGSLAQKGHTIKPGLAWPQSWLGPSLNEFEFVNSEIYKCLTYE